MRPEITHASLEAALPQLRACLALPGSRALLCSPPGTGKTTTVPLALLTESWMSALGATTPAGASQPTKIIMLEPRRVAARAAARRMATLLAERVGATVGYRVRFDVQVSAETRIEVLTEGLLVRRIQNDPELTGVALVIFDELHERHIQTDLALALTLDVCTGLRPDLRLLAMSATLASASVAAALGDTHSLQVRGQAHPVETHYLGRGEFLPAVRRALAESRGDILAFFPGAREIHAAERELRQAVLAEEIQVCPLFGDLDAASQDRVLESGKEPGRKVVLATNIAETSLTIPGVDAVIDSGLARVPRFDPNAALTRLRTERISQASAAQRRGRAGRLRPGYCYRLWTESEHHARALFTSAEILQADLAPVMLELAAWGATDLATMTFLDPLPRGAVAQARELLAALGALDADGQLTRLGRRMAALPVHPRLAAMLLSASTPELSALACRAASVVEEGTPWSGPASQRPIDLLETLEWLAGSRRDGATNPATVKRIERAERSLRQHLKLAARIELAPPADIVPLLLRGFPDRVAYARAAQVGVYQMANGREVQVRATDAIASAPALVVVDAGGDERGALAYLGVRTTEAQVRATLGDHITEREIVQWDAREQAVTAHLEARLGRLVLSRVKTLAPASQQLSAAMLVGIRQLGLEVLPWKDADRQWLARVKLLRAQALDPAAWPVVDLDVLDENLCDWLGPFLTGITRRGHLDRLVMADALNAMLEWPNQKELDAQAPKRISVPSGREALLHYQSDGPPVLAIALQEMFGATTTPTVAWGKVPVQVQLLSPARRALQVTQDLAGFWTNSYQEVRKEMRGRYPKHSWPEDPLMASPSVGARRRR